MVGAACPLCGGELYVPVIAPAYDRMARKAGVFSFDRCAGCGLVATRPQPDDATLAAYYEAMYAGPASMLASASQKGAGGRWVARRRAAHVLRAMRRTGAKRVVDVGCGYGAFLAALDDAGVPSLKGVDMDAGSIAGAVRPDRIGYTVGDIETLGRQRPGAFDVVTLFQTLEHLRDPVRSLRAAHQLLAPGGICGVEVPDFRVIWRHVFRSWWFPLLVPQHLFHFTPQTLRACMEAAGFEVVESRPMFYPLESTVSLGLWLNDKLGRPLRHFRTQARRPDGWLLGALIAVWWLAVEVPSQALLVLLRRSGHQLMIARKPDHPGPGNPT